VASAANNTARGLLLVRAMPSLRVLAINRLAINQWFSTEPF
jgi:hypothetical protein